MIRLHQENSKNNSILDQYKFMKDEFVEELNQLMVSGFQIKVQEVA